MADDKLILETYLPFRLERLANFMSQEFATVHKERFGMTQPEWRILAALGEHGAMTATQAGAHTAMHKTKVSRAVAELEQRRWLSRTTVEKDRRIELLELTASGMETHRAMVPLATEFETRLFTRLDDAEREILLSAIDRLEHRLTGKLDL